MQVFLDSTEAGQHRWTVTSTRYLVNDQLESGQFTPEQLFEAQAKGWFTEEGEILIQELCLVQEFTTHLDSDKRGQLVITVDASIDCARITDYLQGHIRKFAMQAALRTGGAVVASF